MHFEQIRKKLFISSVILYLNVYLFNEDCQQPVAISGFLWYFLRYYLRQYIKIGMK
jgi:hypothetical protein